jgi:hypothetical protein
MDRALVHDETSSGTKKQACTLAGKLGCVTAPVVLSGDARSTGSDHCDA